VLRKWKDRRKIVQTPLCRRAPRAARASVPCHMFQYDPPHLFC
jgi:hypothetical protein